MLVRFLVPLLFAMVLPTVPVHGQNTNLALNKPAAQSSTGYGGVASRAVDGNTSGDWSRGSVTHTNKQQHPYWQVDLGKKYDVQRIRIWNRTDCCGNRLSDISIEIYDRPGSQKRVFLDSYKWNPGQSNPLTFNGEVRGRYVRIRLNANESLSLAEVEVYGQELPPLTMGSASVHYPALDETYQGTLLESNTESTWQLPVSDSLTTGNFRFTWDWEGSPDQAVRNRITDLVENKKCCIGLIVNGSVANEIQMQFQGRGILVATGTLPLAIAKHWPKKIQLRMTTGADVKPASSSAAIEAVPRSYFDQALLPIFMHERCLNCHEMGSKAILYSKHRRLWLDHGGSGYSTIWTYDDNDDIRPGRRRRGQPEPEPSFGARPQDPRVCRTCHITRYERDDEWRSPKFVEGLDWRNKSPVEVCERVTGPFRDKHGEWQPPRTQQQLYESFHFAHDGDENTASALARWALFEGGPGIGWNGRDYEGPEWLPVLFPLRPCRIDHGGSGCIVDGEPVGPDLGVYKKVRDLFDPWIAADAPCSPNRALNRPTKQSSTGYGGVASRAVDGNTAGVYSQHSISHTNKQQNPWWEVDLGATYDITNIEIWNRTDCCANRLSNISIEVSDRSGASGIPFLAGYAYQTEQSNPLKFRGKVTGRFVRIKLHATNYLALAEVKVYGTKRSAISR